MESAIKMGLKLNHCKKRLLKVSTNKTGRRVVVHTTHDGPESEEVERCVYLWTLILGGCKKKEISMRINKTTENVNHFLKIKGLLRRVKLSLYRSMIKLVALYACGC